MNMMRKNY